MSELPPPPPPPGTPPPPPPESERHDTGAAPILVPGAPGVLASEAAGEAEYDASGHEPGAGRFRTGVAVAIAVISILGAIVAFRGTLAEQDARRLDQQGIQEQSQREQIITNLQAQVDEDIRNAGIYQEHLKASQILSDQAGKATDPSLASSLRADAQAELVLAHTSERFFGGAIPNDSGKSGDAVTYDRDKTLARLEANNDQLRELRPDQTIASADEKHIQSNNLVGLVTLFIAALLFLTLAQFTRRGMREIFAAAGGVVAIAGVLLWIVVERTATT